MASDVAGQPRPVVRHATTIWGTLGALPPDLLQYGLAGSWTSERAENWWKLHMPERITAGTEREAQEDVLQANAQAN